MMSQQFPKDEFEDDLWLAKAPAERALRPHSFDYLLKFPTREDAQRFADRWQTQAARMDAPEYTGDELPWLVRLHAVLPSTLADLAEYERRLIEVAQLTGGRLAKNRDETVASAGLTI